MLLNLIIKLWFLQVLLWILLLLNKVTEAFCKKAQKALRFKNAKKEQQNLLNCIDKSGPTWNIITRLLLLSFAICICIFQVAFMTDFCIYFWRTVRKLLKIFALKCNSLATFFHSFYVLLQNISSPDWFLHCFKFCGTLKCTENYFRIFVYV